MNNYDSEYYFISYKSTESRPILAADADTATLAYTSEALPLGGRPLKFHNGAATSKNKHLFSKKPPEIIFHGSDIAVENEIYEKLSSIEIPNLVLQPAIYIDHNDVWHENYWFLTFTKKLDCWDRDKSLYAPDPLTGFGDIRYEVISYHLKKSVLDLIPISERKLFKMGATTEGWLLVHKSIAGLFKKTGAELVPVKEFGTTFFP
ncbi:hypothetical protein HA052_19355 [Chromobacterium haemolyticum]|uniref:Uncharacterized protein n=1 Tax=Chromobacterium fluminis TaxID=3044269 RepID=A0ABX0LFZ9_9NEIS|nr:hypothetical protein [Chromobacterium haemolyticum]NHR07350.1 hypothetical protein [Chromobacterium haemolyticum]